MPNLKRLLLLWYSAQDHLVRSRCVMHYRFTRLSHSPSCYLDHFHCTLLHIHFRLSTYLRRNQTLDLTLGPLALKAQHIKDKARNLLIKRSFSSPVIQHSLSKLNPQSSNHSSLRLISTFNNLTDLSSPSHSLSPLKMAAPSISTSSETSSSQSGNIDITVNTSGGKSKAAATVYHFPC